MELAVRRHHLEFVTDTQLAGCVFRELPAGLHTNSDLDRPMPLFGTNTVGASQSFAVTFDLDRQVLSGQECERRLQLFGNVERDAHRVPRFLFFPGDRQGMILPHAETLICT